MTANKTQVGGTHYSTQDGFQHWDMVQKFKLDYFQGQITKYVMRWNKKNGVEDLKKARHFLDKYIELQEPPAEEPQGKGYVNQDWSEALPPNWKTEGFLAGRNFYVCQKCKAASWAISISNALELTSHDKTGACKSAQTGHTGGVATNQGD